MTPIYSLGRVGLLAAAVAATTWSGSAAAGAANNQVPLQRPLTEASTFSSSSSSSAPPLLGFGTWNLDTSAANTTASVALAIRHGYRHIDCAAAYGNEEAVGRGIARGLAEAGLSREDVWVTSKLWNDDHGGEAAVGEALDRTLRALGLDYLDLYLMHWPVKVEEEYLETWKSLEKALATGKVRNIGVCNFSPHQLQRLLDSARTRPAVHQFELHPYLQQAGWVAWHRARGIHVTAYSPLGNTNPTYRGSGAGAAADEGPPLLVENPELSAVGARRGCSAAQVALAWGIGRGTSVIPKSKHERWIEENIGALECELEDEDLDVVAKVGDKYLARFNNPSKSWGVKLFEGLDDA